MVPILLVSVRLVPSPALSLSHYALPGTWYSTAVSWLPFYPDNMQNELQRRRPLTKYRQKNGKKETNSIHYAHKTFETRRRLFISGRRHIEVREVTERCSLTFLIFCMQTHAHLGGTSPDVPSAAGPLTWLSYLIRRLSPATLNGGGLHLFPAQMVNQVAKCTLCII